MSFTPALLANRRWCPAGMSLEELTPPSPAQVLNGTPVSRAAASSSPLSVPVPAGTKPGDLMIMFMTILASAPNTIVNGLTGWSYLGGTQSVPSVYAVSKTYAASDGSTISFPNATAQAMVAHIVTISGRTWSASGSGFNAAAGTSYNHSLLNNPGYLYLLGFSVNSGASNLLQNTPSYTQLMSNTANALFRIDASLTNNVAGATYTWTGSAQSTGVQVQVSNTGFKDLWVPGNPVMSPWYEMKDAAPYDTFTMDAGYGAVGTSSPNAGMVWRWELGVGAAGAEQIIIPSITLNAQYPATYGGGGVYMQQSIPVAIKAGQRIAVRGYHNSYLAAAAHPPLYLAFGGV